MKSLRPRQALLAFIFAIAVVGCIVFARRKFKPKAWGSAPPVASGTSSATQLLPPARRSQRLGGLDVTFLVMSDTHLGFDADETDSQGKIRDPLKDPADIDRINQLAISEMNGMPSRAWPAELGGKIGAPRGLLVTGDLTELGEAWQWRHFVAHYGLNGGDGLLRYPVFEGHGNHDKAHGWYVLERVRERHGGIRYAFDWDDLHLVCLGEAPDDDDLKWLAGDLASVGSERPVVLYFHFPLRGPFSENWFGDGNYRDTLAQVVSHTNLVAIFHGHYHKSGRYRWHGIDVYKPGAAKHERYAFLVVHIDDSRLRVAAWQFKEKFWQWWAEKPINGGAGQPRSGGVGDDRERMLPDE